MVEQVRTFEAQSLERVVFAVFGDEAYSAFVSASGL